MSEKYCLVYTTGDSKENLESIAEKLLEKKLVACANIYPEISSIYKWENQIEKSNEIAMVLKTKIENYSELEKEITKLHSYDCPAILQIPISKLNKSYASWLEESLS
ncbi:MAG: divalent-cation tolerance protein CutA [Candidatus Caenarcaniphilales bacterium]|nr:divalent-cation tolerance protein CutA [Candidatus Caenarcaniphilales bacterium]